MSIDRLDWDSDHFGIEIYQLKFPVGTAGSVPRIETDVHEAHELGARLVLRRLLAISKEIYPLINGGFQMGDDMVTMTAGRTAGPLSGLTRQRRNGDSSESVLVGPFPSSRFETIPALASRGGSSGVYRHYLDEAVSGRIVLRDGIHAGFTAWSIQDNVGLLDMVIVQERWRGKGLGTTLVGDTLRDMADRGLSGCQATTWVNEPAALAVYRKAGFHAYRRIQTWWKEL